MKREQLEHVLRAASQIAGDPDILVIGSQSVLGAIPEERLPPAATALRQRLRSWISRQRRE
jgi:hypothetical protein